MPQQFKCNCTSVYRATACVWSYSLAGEVYKCTELYHGWASATVQLNCGTQYKLISTSEL